MEFLIKKFTSVYNRGNISNSSTKLIKERVNDRNNPIQTYFPFSKSPNALFSLSKNIAKKPTWGISVLCNVTLPPE
jgi:hypothetical protein